MDSVRRIWSKGALSLVLSALVITATGGSEFPLGHALDNLNRSPEKVAAAANPAPPTVVVVRAILADNGDGDAWADTNETIEMRLVVYNRFGVNLTGVVATLTTNDPKIACVSNSVLQIGDLKNREVSETAQGFVFAVSDVDRTSPAESFSVRFEIAMSADQFEALPAPEKWILDLDLDVSGGAGTTTYFEGFEEGFGSFTPMPLDQDLNPPDGDLDNDEAGLQNSDGYRCQYNDPDWEGSNLPGKRNCYLGNELPDRFWFHTTDDRAFSGNQSLHFGEFVDPSAGFTTPLAQLEAMRTMEPINLAWGRVCSETRSTICEADLECPVSESCTNVTPTLSIKHQISQMDHRYLSGGVDGLRGVDRAVVHVQRTDTLGQSYGNWIKLYPYLNVYDTQANSVFFNCSFDPTDDGNTEEDFFDPSDPERRLGPSSTCVPERTFVDQGDTADPFDPSNIGDASDGPGLEGESGTGTWVESKFDLSRFAGHRIRLRFLESGLQVAERAGTWFPRVAPITAIDDGWFIDDVMITDTLNVPALVGADPKDNLDIKADWDFDGVGATCDCAPEVSWAWGIPGPTSELRLSHSLPTGQTHLTWNVPSNGGALFSFDVLRSSDPTDFVTEGIATCVETGEPQSAEAVDDVIPAPGVTHYFLIRAENECSMGSLGEASSGQARIGLVCSP